MTKPNPKFITILKNRDRLCELLVDLVLSPREQAIRWSMLTKQTPNMRIGYPGQHLASLVTGMEGHRSGARGHDLADGSEVKSCSRIDQLDKCKDCGASVARLEEACPECESTRIVRKADSKWLFTIRSEEELRVLTKEVPRVLLLLGDYPEFGQGNFTILRFQAFELWNTSARHQAFSDLMEGYYRNIYMEHRRATPDKTPAPKNFWPYSFQFYMCNPIKVFEATVDTTLGSTDVEIVSYVEPHVDRADLPSEPMPSTILTPAERQNLAACATLEQLRDAIDPGILGNARTMAESQLRNLLRTSSAARFTALLPWVGEDLRSVLTLRATDRIATAGTAYTRAAIR